MNRTVEQLADNSGEKKELLKELRRLSIGPIVREVFRDMQQMSHDHSMFFVIICLYT